MSLPSDDADDFTHIGVRETQPRCLCTETSSHGTRTLSPTGTGAGRVRGGSPRAVEEAAQNTALRTPTGTGFGDFELFQVLPLGRWQSLHEAGAAKGFVAPPPSALISLILILLLSLHPLPFHRPLPIPRSLSAFRRLTRFSSLCFLLSSSSPAFSF